jgi:hypothetical protein
MKRRILIIFALLGLLIVALIVSNTCIPWRIEELSREGHIESTEIRFGSVWYQGERRARMSIAFDVLIVEIAVVAAVAWPARLIIRRRLKPT